MPSLTPHLWFDKEAKQAAALYTAAFPNSAIRSSAELHGTPSGSVDLITIELAGQEFRLINAGPYFKFTPAISFLVACQTRDEVDAVWRQLSSGGVTMMELGQYPFSEHYGWTQDRFGLSWQVMLMPGGGEVKQKIIPTLMFVGDRAGKAEEAIAFYTSLFPASGVGHLLRYTAADSPDKEGTIRHAGFRLNGQEFAAMDSARGHGFDFNEAISFIVNCDTQEELDSYWTKLSAVPEAEQCGWLKDRYGVSWQVVPTLMDRMLASNDKTALARVTEAFLKMKKFDIAKLEAAYSAT